MPRYWVTVKEVWERRVLMTAPDQENALKKVYDGSPYVEDAFDFDSYLKDDWRVEPIDD